MPSTGTSTTSCKTDEAWINEVRNNVNLALPMDHPDNPCTIFKVPKHIRRLDSKAYNPVIAFLGIFHQSHGASSVMQYKWRCVRHLLSRHGSEEHANQLLDKCLLELKNQDDKVQSCYSQELPRRLDAQKLASIMLLDGCFIIYLMLKMYARKKRMEEETEKEEKESLNKEIEREEDAGKKMRECRIEIETREGEVVLNIEKKEKLPEDPTMAGLFTLDLVVHDLLKLENQIPFFIIQLLFDHLKTSKDGKIDLVDLALQLFKEIHPKESKSFEKKSPNEYHHLLHLFHSSRIPSKKPPEPPSTPNCFPDATGHMHSKCKKAGANPSQGALASAPKWTPNAMELKRAGMKFKRKEPTDNFLDIKFEWKKTKIPWLQCFFKSLSGRMEIPPMQIYDYTGPLFQNLIAFEQCYYVTEMYFTIYALFMDYIIDQAEDVLLLQLEGILEHRLSNDQAVADLFNRLGSQIHFTWEKNYLAKQIEEINEFYETKYHKWLAALRRDYLRNPWATISVLAAIVLLLLTVEQAVFSALSYFHSS